MTQILKSANHLFTTLVPLKSIDDEQEPLLIKNYEFIPADVYIMDLASTLGNTFLVSTLGIVYSWGGQTSVLGRPVQSSQDSQKPTPIPIFTQKIVQIAAGNNHMLALDLNGILYSWGENSLGQLGQGDQDEYRIPKEIEYFKRDLVVQIYAGGNCSYAVTKKGNLFAWGDNQNSQLGLMGEYHLEPKLLIQTPWESSNIDMKIVYGKNNTGYIFKAPFNQDSGGVEKPQELTYRVKELEIKLYSAQKKLHDLESQTYGKTAQQQQQSAKLLLEDYLLKSIGIQQLKVKTEIDANSQHVTNVNEEIKLLEIELSSIKNQLIEISGKENNLISKRDQNDNAIKKENRVNKEGNVSADLEILLKNQKRIKELLQANDNIKNTLIKKQNELDVSRFKITDSLTQNNTYLEDLRERQRLLADVEVERKKTLKTAFLTENKADLEKIMAKIYYFFKTLLETNISEIAKRSNKIIGLEEMLSISNGKLKYIRTELQTFKINPNDSSYDMLTKILEIVQDNLATRVKLNDYTGGLILQVSQQNEDFIQNLKVKNDKEEPSTQSKKNRKKMQSITDFVNGQKKQIYELGKHMTDAKGYTLELRQQINGNQSSKK